MTEGDTHESPQFDHLTDDVGIFADPDSVIWVFECEPRRYFRLCEVKHSDDDFVIPLHSNAPLDALEIIQNIEVTDENRMRRVRSERIGMTILKS